MNIKVVKITLIDDCKAACHNDYGSPFGDMSEGAASSSDLLQVTAAVPLSKSCL